MAFEYPDELDLSIEDIPGLLTLFDEIASAPPNRLTEIRKLRNIFNALPAIPSDLVDQGITIEWLQRIATTAIVNEALAVCGVQLPENSPRVDEVVEYLEKTIYREKLDEQTIAWSRASMIGFPAVIQVGLLSVLLNNDDIITGPDFELVKHKRFLSIDLLSRGFGISFFPLVKKVQQLLATEEITPAEASAIYTECFSPAAVREVEYGEYVGGIGLELLSKINSFLDEEDDFVITIGDDVVVQGHSFTATAEEIIRYLHYEKGRSQEQIERVLSSIRWVCPGFTPEPMCVSNVKSKGKDDILCYVWEYKLSTGSPGMIAVPVKL